MKRLISLSFLTALFACLPVFALEVPKAPTLEKPIIDQSQTLTAEQIDQLSQKINQSRQEKDYQIGILMINSLEDEALEPYAIEVAREWGIGDKEKDNGVLFLIAKDDRKLRIEVGRDLEGDLTDVKAARIIRNVVAPKFKQNDYYGGIEAGVTEIHNVVTGKPSPATESNAQTGSSSSEWGGIAFFILMFGSTVLSWIVSMLARSKSWWAGGVLGGGIGAIVVMIFNFSIIALIGAGLMTIFGFILDYVVSRSYKKYKEGGGDPPWWTGGTWISGGGSGWGGGSSGGGGFGGGGFDGGGASGDW